MICIGWWYFDTILLMSLLRQFEIDGIHADAGGKKMSRPAFEHILTQNIQENLPTESWHNWKVPRVLHVGMPRRNETTLEQPFNSALDLGASAYIWKHAADLFATRLLEIGIQNIAQPKQTIGEHGLSPKAIRHRDPKTDFAGRSCQTGLRAHERSLRPLAMARYLCRPRRLVHQREHASVADQLWWRQTQATRHLERREHLRDVITGFCKRRHTGVFAH